MVLTKQQREEKDDWLKNSKVYWIFIGAWAFVFLLLARRAMVHVNNKMLAARREVFTRIKIWFIVFLVVLILFGLFIVFLNYLWKKDERDEHL